MDTTLMQLFANFGFAALMSGALFLAYRDEVRRTAERNALRDTALLEHQTKRDELLVTLVRDNTTAMAELKAVIGVLCTEVRRDERRQEQ